MHAAPPAARRPFGPGSFVRRTAIAGLLATLLSGFATTPGWAIWPFGASTEAEPSDAGSEVGAFLSEMIRVPTFEPPGNEEIVARLIVDRLTDAGIEARVIDTPGLGRAAAWARVPGRGDARPIVLLSHIDVVPADASAWQRDPFGGEIDQGRVHGRGTLDAKGVTAVHVYTLLALASRDAPLDRDVILLATPGEETGGLDGAGYIARRHPVLFENAEFLLTEGGSIRPRRRGPSSPDVPPMWGITITEKSPCWLELSTTGTPGHGSSPRRDAAVPRLIAALDRVRRVESPVRVLTEVETMFLALAASAPMEDRAGFISLATSLEEESDFARRFLSHPSYNALVRNTISITVLEGGVKTNVVPGVARARLDVRLLPGERCEDFVRAIEDVIGDPLVQVDTLLAFPSRSSPSDTALFQAIERVARRQDPEAIVVPRMIGGFTDAHWFRELGIVSYGFVPRWLAPSDATGVHGIDESVSLENLERGVATQVEILEVLSGAAPAQPREQSPEQH